MSHNKMGREIPMINSYISPLNDDYIAVLEAVKDRASTIKEDDGIKGAILVDCVLIREGNLQYPEGMQTIDKNSIDDPHFIELLKGVPVFIGHPAMVSSNNYGIMMSESVGSVVDAWLSSDEHGLLIKGTLRIAQNDAIDLIKNKHYNKGSLGYFAKTINEGGKLYQRELKPNHYAITNLPRDERVEIFNEERTNAMTNIPVDANQIASLVDDYLKAKDNKEMTIETDRRDIEKILKIIELYLPDHIKASIANLDLLKKISFLSTYIDTGIADKEMTTSAPAPTPIPKQEEVVQEKQVEVKEVKEDKGNEEKEVKEEVKEEEIKEVKEEDKEEKKEVKEEDKKENKEDGKEKEEKEIKEEKKEEEKEETKEEEKKNSNEYIIPSSNNLNTDRFQGIKHILNNLS